MSEVDMSQHVQTHCQIVHQYMIPSSTFVPTRRPYSGYFPHFISAALSASLGLLCEANVHRASRE